MSMRSYPLTGTIFFVDSIAAAFIRRELDRRYERLTSELAALTDDEFLAAAKQKTLPDSYYDFDYLLDALDEMDICSNSEFEGHVETKYPDAAQDRLNVDIDGDLIVYFPLMCAPFAQNQDKEAILAEFQEPLAGLLPESYDWWRNICVVSGTTFS